MKESLNFSLNFKEYKSIHDVNCLSWELWGNKSQEIKQIMDNIYTKRKETAEKKKQSIPTKDILLVPLIYSKKFTPGRILFIGMNPSFSIKGIKKVIKEKLSDKMLGNIPYSEIDFGEFYQWDNQDTFERHVAIEIDNAATNVYDEYFKKFKEISMFLFGDNEQWEHIDLFFMRMTSQNRMLNILRKDRDFEKSQLEASLSLIKLAKPSVIVIANAGATDKLSEYYLLSSIKNDCDYRFLHVPGAENIPVFNVSMLTGQRALDKGSLHLLKRCLQRAIG